MLLGHYCISWVVEVIWPHALQRCRGGVLIDLKGLACCVLVLFTLM